MVSQLSGPIPFLIAVILGGWLAFRSGRAGRRFIPTGGLVAVGGVLALFACLALAGMIDANESGGRWYESSFVTDQLRPSVYRAAVLVVIAGTLHFLGRKTRPSKKE